MPLPTAVTMPNLVILRSQNWGALGHRPLMVWAWLTHRFTLLRTGYRAEFGLSRGNGMSDIKEIRLKIWPFASCLSRSLKVIGTDTDRSATCDFLVTFYFNHGPISYRFRDKRQFQSNSQIFPTRVYFTPPPTEGVPLGIGYRRSRVAIAKTRMIELPGQERSLTISSAVWIQHTNAMDRRTDGQWPTAKTALRCAVKTGSNNSSSSSN